MTEQDFRDGAARLAISPTDRYARAGAHVDRDPAPVDPARARVLAGRRAVAAVVVAAEPAGAAPATSTGQPRRSNGRFAHYPLRRRAERIRKLGHAAQAAAETPRDEMAAAVDYARRVAAAADEAGMRDARFTAKFCAAIQALMDAGDTGTDAMHTWRPAP